MKQHKTYICVECDQECDLYEKTWVEPVEFWGYRTLEPFSETVSDCCKAEFETVEQEEAAA